MKFLSVLVLFMGSGAFANPKLPATQIDCSILSGDSTLKRFSLQVYNEEISAILDLEIVGESKLFSYPDLFKDLSLSKPVKNDGKNLSFQLNYSTHDQNYYDISVDLVSRKAFVDEADYYDIPTPATFSGEYGCSID